jgi:tubulin-folding cofactor B
MAEVDEERHPWAQAFRDYVTQDDEDRFANQGDGYLRLDITHSNLEQRWHDILVWPSMTIFELKEKLHRHCGSGVSFVDLYLRRGHGTSDTVFLADEDKTLGYYGAQNGMHLHMVDNDAHSISAGGWLENVNLVEKYVMSEEEYNKRDNTVRKYKEKMIVKDPTFKFFRKEDTEAKVEYDWSKYEVGGRCELNPGGRRGTIRYVGPMVEEAADDSTKVFGLKDEIKFLGIQLDEPTGHNDGSVGGHKYFECPAKYGVFAKPGNVEVGDFPELDPFADLDSEDEI